MLASIYNDRVVPLKQLKAIADAYAVNMVDSTHKTRDGIFTAAQGVKAIDDAHSVIETQWKAYVATNPAATVGLHPGRSKILTPNRSSQPEIDHP